MDSKPRCDKLTVNDYPTPQSPLSSLQHLVSFSSLFYFILIVSISLPPELVLANAL